MTRSVTAGNLRSPKKMTLATLRCRRMMLSIAVIAAGWLLSLEPPPASGVTREKIGRDDPVPLVASWPAGVNDVLAHSSRVLWRETNGNHFAWYSGDARSLEELIWLFWEIKFVDHELILLSGNPTVVPLNPQAKAPIPFNAKFEVSERIVPGPGEKARVGGPDPATMLGLPSLSDAGPPATPRLTIYLVPEFGIERTPLASPGGASPQAISEAVKVKTQALKHQSRFVRAIAANQLGDIGKAASPAIDALLAALGDESEYVRASAARALGRIGTREPRVIESLEGMKKDNSPLVQQAARTALSMLQAPVTTTQPADTRPGSRPASDGGPDPSSVRGPGASMPAAAPPRADQSQLLQMATLDLGEGYELNMVLIPAGEFMMGSRMSPAEAADMYDGREEMYTRSGYPPRRVRISRAFYIGTTEVTVAQFREFVERTDYKTDAERGTPNLQKGEPGAFAWGSGSTPWTPGATWRDPGFPQGDDSPVVMVSWNDGVAFCEWLSRKAGRRFRLPTEAEWEYACRAGTATEFWWGDELDDKGTFANVAHHARDKMADEPPPDDGYQNTAPVGRFPANAFGLHDMVGNAVEWCEDVYIDPRTDRTGPGKPPAERRAARGGSWFHPGYRCCSTDHHGLEPEYRTCYTGFRVVAEAVDASSRPEAGAHVGLEPISAGTSGSGTTGGLSASARADKLPAAPNRGELLSASASRPAGWTQRLVPNPHVPLPPAAPETPAEREYNALLRLVKRRQLTFDYVRSHVRQDQLPRLYEMLKDPALIRLSAAVATSIAYAAYDTKDDRAAEALIECITRTDDWRGLDEDSERYLVYRKLFRAELLGLIGGKLANETLRRWVAPEGAKELAAAWGTKMSQHYQTEASLTHQVRSNAAVGLVLTQEPSNIAIVRDTYERERVYPNDWKEKGLYPRDRNTMVEAMATQALIEDHGMHGWLSRVGQDHQLMDLLFRYLDRYMSYPPDWPHPRRTSSTQPARQRPEERVD